MLSFYGYSLYKKRANTHKIVIDIEMINAGWYNLITKKRANTQK